MLLAGGRGGTRAPDQPRVVQLQISRPRVALPRRSEPLEFVVALHVEGTPVTWQRNALLARDDEQLMLVAVDGLRRWSDGVGLSRRQARVQLRQWQRANRPPRPARLRVRGPF